MRKDKLKEVKINFLDPISIIWIDALSPHLSKEDVHNVESKDSNWYPLEELKKMCDEKLEVESIGMLVWKGKNYTAISSSFDKGDVIQPLLIPNSSILNIRKLK